MNDFYNYYSNYYYFTWYVNDYGTPITIYGVISIIIFSICALTIIGFSFLDGSNEEYGVNFIPFL